MPLSLQFVILVFFSLFNVISHACFEYIQFVHILILNISVQYDRESVHSNRKRCQWIERIELSPFSNTFSYRLCILQEQ